MKKSLCLLCFFFRRLALSTFAQAQAQAQRSSSGQSAAVHEQG
ncbi:hypothetical protein [Sporisorium scitamineum]|uniref:Uncharacterized protein n=1 Tax=Sporisorium scitamineum TaxID=49012 RepID=A0A0F7S928_9BASI|nr:hypothetical protein [Sporisorium scitamineum]